MEQARLGDKVKCQVTGVAGIVTAVSSFLWGCDRIGVQQPLGGDGKVPDTFWADIDSVTILERSVVKGHTEIPKEEKTGGPLLPCQIPTRSNPK